MNTDGVLLDANSAVEDCSEIHRVHTDTMEAIEEYQETADDALDMLQGIMDYASNKKEVHWAGDNSSTNLTAENHFHRVDTTLTMNTALVLSDADSAVDDIAEIHRVNRKTNECHNEFQNEADNALDMLARIADM